MDMNRFKLSGHISETTKNVMVGKAFAFLDPNVLKDSDLSWLAKMLGHKHGTPLIVSLAGPESVTLAGVTIAPLKLDEFRLKSIVSDKDLYRQSKDTINLLVLNPTAPRSTATVSLNCNGSVSSRHHVELGENGEGSLKLRDLLVGDYQIFFEGDEKPACDFVVAEYRLVPLVASLTSSSAGPDEQLDVVLHLESFGVPVNGPVRLNIMDVHTQIAMVSASATDGVVQATFQLKGAGPHSIAVQLEEHPSKTATVPLRGSREAERKETVFASLGTEVVGSLLPISVSAPVRGIYLKEGALKVSPISLDKVDDDRARFTVNVDISAMTVVVVDPTFPMAKPGAVDVSTAVHPDADPLYKESAERFTSGKYAEACEKFESRRKHFDHPHPYYSYWMACCYAKGGQVDEAVKALRQSIIEGWTDLSHLANDDDLSTLRGYEPYEKLLTGGRLEVKFSNLSAGDKIDVAVGAPMSLVLIGAISNGKPWEGWCTVVTPSTVSAEVTVPEICTPGKKVTIKFSTETNGASIYAIIKDARLTSADTPELKLAAAIKNYVEANGDRLANGSPADSLKQILSSASGRESGGGAWGMSGSFGSSPWNEMTMARLNATPPPPGFAGSDLPQRRSAQSSSDDNSWGGSDNLPMSGMAPTPMQQGGGPGEKFGASMLTGTMNGSAPLTLAESIRQKMFTSVPMQAQAMPEMPSAPAKKLAAVFDDPEVLFAGFVELKKGKGSVKILLPDSFSNYTVESFAIGGMHWASKETRFKAAKDPYVQLTTPVFATKSEPGVGFVHVGSSTNAKVTVLFDGKPIQLYDAAGAKFDGEVSGPSTAYTFVAEPGHFETILERDGSVAARHVKLVNEPGKLKRVVRSLRVLTAGDSISLKDDSNLYGLQVLPGLENDLTVLLDATADYSHCCCEQTAAKIMSGCAMYVQANGDGNRKQIAESIILAGIKREQSMWMKGKGFKSYPHFPAQTDDYYGPKAARYLRNLSLLESNESKNSISKELKAAITSGLEMAEDAYKAYRLNWPPTLMANSEEAYNALCFTPGVDQTAALNLARAVDPNMEQSMKAETVNPFLGRKVGARLEQAYAAAALLRKGTSSDLKLALKLANTIISQFNEQGRLYSTVDSVAAIALMTELQNAGITRGGGKVELNGKTFTSDDAIAETETIQTLKVLEGAVTIAVERTVEEDWTKFEAGVPLRISLEKDGAHTRAFTAGDTVDLVVTLEENYTMGDLLWVALPDALSRVIGGGQVKLFSLDFAGANELRVSLAATGTTDGTGGTLREQSLALCVRNMFNEERAGNPGLIKVSVKR
ncbi:MAG: hypothetical protein SGJ27_19075 [Candidatus Melainabacteria bacterium]|nr:hypothetical protein [Candidatus Melainabacteria bacterium]